jgi:hypothetical protein
MPETFDWPEDIRPRECAFWLQANTTLLASPITSAAQALARPGARFVCELALDPVNAATSGRLDALLARLQGPLNRVRLWDFRRALPRGPAGSYGMPTPGTFAWTPGPSWTDGTTWEDAAQAASPEVRLAVARGATEIATWGWAANAVPLLAGDYVGLLGRAHMLVEDAPNAGVLGRAVLSILPSLRDDVPAGAAIVVQRASAPFRLVDNDQPANRTRPGPFATYALRFIEDLT